MRKSQSGATVVVVISVIATLAIFTGAAMDYTFTVARNVERSNKMESEMGIANGCLNEQFMYWREICRANSSQGQGPTTSAFSSIPLPTTTQFPHVAGFTASTGTASTYTVSRYNVTAVTPELVPLSGSTATVPGVGTTGSNLTYYYKATATVNMPDRGANVTTNMAEIFEQEYQNPWDWALFFVDPLEIEPGEPMTVNGWVQTNSSLWTPLNTLTFTDKVTYGSTWNINAMAGDNHLISDGDTYASPNYPSNLPPSQGTPGEPFGLNPTDVFSNSNSNSNGYHELIEVPDPHYPDPVSTDRYFDQAGVKVVVYENGGNTYAYIYDNTAAPTVNGGSVGGNGVITGGNMVLGHVIGTMTYNGSSTTRTSGSGNSTNQAALFTSVSNAISLGSTLQDNRQGATMALTTLNIGTLSSQMTSTGASFNQVIYIADLGTSSPTGTSLANPSNATLDRGVEITNGASLPTNGLTIASQNPVYLVGDYNTGNSPGSNSGTPTSNTASGYTWQPSSIAADAVNVLSNAWTDSESTTTESSRVASNTTINSAIMSGNVPTSGGNYSGGAENFPRFLENWSGKTLTYYGSMVELYASEQATGIWGSSNVYDPPTRDWYYDNNFQIHPPPGSIMVVDYIKGQWFQY
jgi:hypothetical protein